MNHSTLCHSTAFKILLHINMVPFRQVSQSTAQSSTNLTVSEGTKSNLFEVIQVTDERPTERTEFLISLGTSWQCFPQPWQYVLDEALAYAHSKSPAQATEHILLFSRSCLYCLHCFGSWEIRRWWSRQKYLLVMCPICCSCPQLLTGFKCYLWNSYWELADISQIG